MHIPYTLCIFCIDSIPSIILLINTGITMELRNTPEDAVDVPAKEAEEKTGIYVADLISPAWLEGHARNIHAGMTEAGRPFISFGIKDSPLTARLVVGIDYNTVTAYGMVDVALFDKEYQRIESRLPRCPFCKGWEYLQTYLVQQEKKVETAKGREVLEALNAYPSAPY